MSHFAVVAPPYPSHFAAMQALGAELVARGHRVSFFHQPEAQRWVSDTRLGYVEVGHADCPPGSLDHAMGLVARPTGPLQLRQLIRHLAQTTAMLCKWLPAALREQHVDAVICDQMEPAGALAAEHCGLPFFSVACALPINREPGLPLPVMPFNHGLDPRIYEGSERVHDWLMRPMQHALEQACLALGLPARQAAHQCLSPLAQLSQTPSSLDFQRQGLPAHFHAVGPLRSAPCTATPDWAFDAGKPLVFASLGTLQGHRFELFARIAQACRRLDAQLLVAHCGGLSPAQQASLLQLGATLVTDFAPQHWAVRQASVVVSHGGLNTVLDTVAAGTPLLVIPIAFDQPGVAARVRYHRLGEVLSRHAGVGPITAALGRLLSQPAPTHPALQAELATCGGVQRGADILETALRSGKPVLQEGNLCAMT
ncbi:zeaxanthin glucosyltransferase [Pseudomonas sp. S60]|uniref:glycosyltransferase n=1 Tax=Pseudomonas sp. S60 TaxID=211124 RepID=UPI001912009F|nr:glycosyltransferase [Pseudomonas sp. S60]MBK5011512.1 zeaxanthin glucosyltransferase [Pseudomonas sp. S60]